VKFVELLNDIEEENENSERAEVLAGLQEFFSMMVGREGKDAIYKASLAFSRMYRTDYDGLTEKTLNGRKIGERMEKARDLIIHSFGNDFPELLELDFEQ